MLSGLHCIKCGAPFVNCDPRRINARFCSSTCYMQWRQEHHPSKRYRFFLESIAAHGTSDECMEWPYARCGYGYGQVSVPSELRATNEIADGVRMYCHHAAYVLANGPIPNDKYVLHSCDNPPCYNARHLYPGTQQQNMQDMINRGRRWLSGPPNYASGERCNLHKLAESQVLDIRRLWNVVPAIALAERFGVDHTTIRKIGNRKIWKHLPHQAGAAE